MRKKNGIIIATTSLMMLSGGAAWADQAAAPAKPAIPSLADILMSTGITATGYVDATFSGFGYSGSHLVGGAPTPAAGGSDTFNFQQAGLTLAYQPSSGFGALVNPVLTPYSSVYVNQYAPDANYYLNLGTPGAPSVQLFQGFVQYATGPWTIIAGKFATLAGAEVFAPPGNTNVTRSLLFSFEPLTHTGVRATYVANSKATFNIGVNNGWFNSGDENATSPGKTLEINATLTPTKALSWGLTNYYGRDYNLYGSLTGLEMFDTVLTWTANSQLTLIGSFDYGYVERSGASGTPSADWWGIAGYLNYQFNPKWRVSLRGEYFDDKDGYLTEPSSQMGAGSPLYAPGEEDISEVTLTFGWDPTSHLEFRIEGRYDNPDSVKPAPGGPSVDVYSKTEQGWLEALYKF